MIPAAVASDSMRRAGIVPESQESGMCVFQIYEPDRSFSLRRQAFPFTLSKLQMQVFKGWLHFSRISYGVPGRRSHHGVSSKRFSEDDMRDSSCRYVDADLGR